MIFISISAYRNYKYGYYFIVGKVLNFTTRREFLHDPMHLK
jgi:hypothetical protein